ncbi:DUF721 domain-containing protein [Flammeovirga pectinis]|uniref:DUF721 domain-containing protein n=1 Tax=Flammeovirga pectinis TaxID=2494373 RepID=A0A3S9P5Y9_9BACT|nr:DUF721 domain-containing protein [Flammeovirga pectinis]AZQ63583.1 DUF721 domain-containing protein [Flammeovirga pectinis]
MSDDKKIKYRFRKRTPVPKKHETIGVGGAMQEFMKSLKKSHSYNQAVIGRVWGEVMGNTVASRTIDLKLRGKTLYVRLNVPTLKQELNMVRDHVVKRLNDKLGAEVLTEVKFV